MLTCPSLCVHQADPSTHLRFPTAVQYALLSFPSGQLRRFLGVLQRHASSQQLRLELRPSDAQRVFHVDEHQTSGAAHLRHLPSVLNDPLQDHARSGYALPTLAPVVLFLPPATIEADQRPATLAYSNLAQDMVVVAIDCAEALEWATGRHAAWLNSKQGSPIHASFAHSALDARWQDTLTKVQNTSHQAQALITDVSAYGRAHRTKPDAWKRVAQAVAIALHLLEYRRHYEAQKHVFVVPLSSSNQVTCFLVGLVITLVAPTYFGREGGTGLGLAPAVGINDALAVVLGVFYRLAPHMGGAHAEHVYMDDYLLPLECYLRAMRHRNHNSWKLLSDERRGQHARPAETLEHLCFCSLPQAYVERESWHWPPLDSFASGSDEGEPHPSTPKRPRLMSDVEAAEAAASIYLPSFAPTPFRVPDTPQIFSLASHPATPSFMPDAALFYTPPQLRATHFSTSLFGLSGADPSPFAFAVAQEGEGAAGEEGVPAVTSPLIAAAIGAPTPPPPQQQPSPSPQPPQQPSPSPQPQQPPPPSPSTPPLHQPSPQPQQPPSPQPQQPPSPQPPQQQPQPQQPQATPPPASQLQAPPPNPIYGAPLQPLPQNRPLDLPPLPGSERLVHFDLHLFHRTWTDFRRLCDMANQLEYYVEHANNIINGRI